jgi:hypothetical protein
MASVDSRQAATMRTAKPERSAGRAGGLKAGAERWAPAPRPFDLPRDAQHVVDGVARELEPLPAIAAGGLPAFGRSDDLRIAGGKVRSRPAPREVLDVTVVAVVERRL